jgi:hypothetical protein
LSFPSGEARKTLSRGGHDSNSLFLGRLTGKLPSRAAVSMVKRRRAIKIVRVTHKLPQRTNPCNLAARNLTQELPENIRFFSNLRAIQGFLETRATGIFSLWAGLRDPFTQTDRQYSTSFAI